MPNPQQPPVPPEPAPRGLARLKAEGKAQPPMVVRNVDDVLRLGEIFVQSGMFKDAKAVSQAAVKILYGVELGIGPMAAMTGITMVDGSLSIGANLCAARINASPDHRYRVVENTAEVATLEFSAREDGEWIVRGTTTWTIEDAKTAGLLTKANWRSYPRAMLFARAMTEGARVHVAELFGGVPVYTGEELGEDGPPDGFDFEPAPPPEPPPAPVVGEPEPADGEAIDGEVTPPADEPEDPPADEPQEPQDGPEGPDAGPDTPPPPAGGAGPESAEPDPTAADAAWEAAATPTPAEQLAIDQQVAREEQDLGPDLGGSPMRQAPPVTEPAEPGSPRGRLALLRLRGLETMGAADDALAGILEAETGGDPYQLGDDALYERVRGLVVMAAERQPARS